MRFNYYESVDCRDIAMRFLLLSLCLFIAQVLNPVFAQNNVYDSSNKINQLALTMAIVKHTYINSLSDNTIAEKAIRGLLSELDPHSSYLDINEFSMLKDSTAGQVIGIGVEVTIDRGMIKVIAPLDHSPAKKAGIKNGDYITHINGDLVLDIGFNEAISRIKGESGTQVNLTIVRPGDTKPRQVVVVRELIKAPSIETDMIGDHIGYFKISYFGTSSADEARTKLRRLVKSHPKMTGMVIDLRNNPGGLLDAAVEVTDLFLDHKQIGYDKTITTAKERNLKVMQDYKSQTGDMTDNMPLAVVINSGSASGAEIMAAALKDHKRATIVGETSFGKGSIQTVMPLSDETAIKITTGLYYTPAGRVVQSNGVSPDVEAPDLVASDASLLDIREHDYLNAITSDHKRKQDKRSNASHEAEIISNFGFEVYQAYQTLLNKQRLLQCR